MAAPGAEVSALTVRSAQPFPEMFRWSSSKGVRGWGEKTRSHTAGLWSFDRAITVFLAHTPASHKAHLENDVISVASHYKGEQVVTDCRIWGRKAHCN